VVGDLGVRSAEHQDLHELVENDSVSDPGTVAAQRVAVEHGRDQFLELVPEGVNDPRWDGGHGGTWSTVGFSQVPLVTGAVPVSLQRHTFTYPRNL